MQKSSTIESYIDKICTKSGLSGTQLENLRQDLKTIAEPYITAIKAVEDAESTIEVKIDELRALYPENQRLDLIQEIVNILGIPNLGYSKISVMLFKDKNHLLRNFLNVNPSQLGIKKRPKLSMLNRMKYYVEHSDFNTLFGILDNDMIALVKEQIIHGIDRWIRSNPFDADYYTPSTLGFKVLYGPDIDDMTYDLLHYIWNTFVIYTDNPKITFEDIRSIINAKTSFLVLLTRDDTARLITTPTLESTKTKLREAIAQETDQSKKLIYKNTINIIDAYLDINAEARNTPIINKRPTHKSLRNLFRNDQYIRGYLIMNLLSRDLGFDPLFFDSMDEELFDTASYQLHHKYASRSWSIYLRDLMVTRNRYHRLYTSTHISSQDTDILLEGMNKLKEIAIDRYSRGEDNWEITEVDIESVFTHLGGGSMYQLSDGRTVLDWWKDGSSIATKVKSEKAFSSRLKEFNDRIEFLVDSKHDYEKWLIKFYPDHAPAWIDKGKVQMASYEWMAENLKHLRFYVHLEDIDFVRDTWGVFI